MAASTTATALMAMVTAMATAWVTIPTSARDLGKKQNGGAGSWLD